MRKLNVTGLEARIITILESQGDKPLTILSRDCCSELSRLVGNWIHEENKPDQVYILKGQSTNSETRSHDLLAFADAGKITVVDPTIWQFFPDAKTIIVGTYPSLEKTYVGLEGKYGGMWALSEELHPLDDGEEKQVRRQIAMTVRENIADSNIEDSN